MYLGEQQLGLLRTCLQRTDGILWKLFASCPGAREKLSACMKCAAEISLALQKGVQRCKMRFTPLQASSGVCVS